MSTHKIVEGLKEAVAGNVARITVDGQTWVRSDLLITNRLKEQRKAQMERVPGEPCILIPREKVSVVLDGTNSLYIRMDDLIEWLEQM